MELENTSSLYQLRIHSGEEDRCVQNVPGVTCKNSLRVNGKYQHNIKTNLKETEYRDVD